MIRNVVAAIRRAVVAPRIVQFVIGPDTQCYQSYIYGLDNFGDLWCLDGNYWVPQGAKPLKETQPELLAEIARQQAEAQRG